MERSKRAICSSAVILSLLVACNAPNARKDHSERPTTEDLGPLPENVTSDNARQVVRMCLQRHREDEGDIHRRYGYAFRSAGFVQLYRHNPAGQSGRERFRRVYVDYKSISKVLFDDYVDTAQFSSRTQIAVKGKFRQWKAYFSPYRDQPELDREPGVGETDVFLIEFDDEQVAKKLVDALRLLSKG